MTADRPLLAIALALGFCVLAPLTDAMSKLLVVHMGLGELLFIRFALQTLLLLPVVLILRLRIILPMRSWLLLTLRTVLHICGSGAMFLSLRYLPLADAVAIAYVMPFFMLLLGWTVLGEAVGPQRLWACVFGFAGTLLVVQPNFAEVGWPALLPVAVAVFFALFMMVTRLIAKEINALSLQLVSGAQATVLLAPLVWLVPAASGLGLAQSVGQFGWLLLLMGLVGTAGHLLMTLSLRYAPSATLAPVQYLEIPSATVIGLLVFGDFPDALALAGIVLTCGAGLFIVMRERAIARQQSAI